MKRFFVCLLVTLMLFSFMACGSETNVPEKEEASAPLVTEEPEPTPTPDPWIRVETEEEAEESAGFGIRLPIMEEASITYNVKTLGDPVILEAVFANGEDMAFTVRKVSGTENTFDDTNTYAYTEETNLYPGYFPVTLNGESDQDIRLVTWTQTVEDAEYSYSVSFAENSANYAGALKVVMAVAEELPDVDDYTVASSIVACGENHTVAIKKDGTVVAVGDNQYGQCDVSGWTDIVQVAAGRHHTVGLKADGTVVATGWNAYGQCNVEDLANIKQVVCATTATFALSVDGTIHFNSPYHFGRFDESYLSSVNDVVAIANDVILHVDGSATQVSIFPYTFKPTDLGISELNAFERIVCGNCYQFLANNMEVKRKMYQLTDGNWVHMSSDGGHVVISEFENAIYLAPAFSFWAALMPDGTVVPAGITQTWYQWDFTDALDKNGEFSCRNWTNIIALGGNATHSSTGTTFIVGVHEDGTAVAAGYNTSGQCDVSDWTDIGYPYHLASKIVEPVSLSFAELAASGEAEAVGNGLDRSAT